MKALYKGYEIEVNREQAMGGRTQIYYSIFRLSDMREVVCDFTQSDETVREVMKNMKDRIDEEHKTDDPRGEKADEEQHNKYYL